VIVIIFKSNCITYSICRSEPSFPFDYLLLTNWYIWFVSSTRKCSSVVFAFKTQHITYMCSYVIPIPHFLCLIYMFRSCSSLCYKNMFDCYMLDQYGLAVARYHSCFISLSRSSISGCTILKCPEILWCLHNLRMIFFL
jgi:hypothetical protein